MFEDFPIIFVLLISGLLALRLENKFCIVSILSNLLRFIFWPRIRVCLGRWFLGLWSILPCWVNCPINVQYSLLVNGVEFYTSVHFLLNWYRRISRDGCCHFQLKILSGFIYFSFSCQVLLHIFCSSIVWCICIQSRYVLLVDPLLYPLSGNFLCLEV